MPPPEPTIQDAGQRIVMLRLGRLPKRTYTPKRAHIEPLQLHEIRVITDAEQRNVMFRFSRPPENLHCFPLSAPSRLAIDVTDSIEAPPQVARYIAEDPQIEEIRVSSSAGRMRLVVELALDETPPVSVDTNEAILTARIGRKTKTASSKHRDAQILFIAENADLTQLAQTPSISRVNEPFWCNASVSEWR